ncbi:hypothetical protein NP006_23490 [Salmonella enterica]|nr:hypothetical protein [Salmonella enterica]
MGIEDNDTSSEEEERSSSDEERSSSEGGAQSSDLDSMVRKVKKFPPKILAKYIQTLNDDIAKAKSRNKILKHDMHVLEEENKDLREKVDYFTKALEKFELGSKTLNMIIGTQRASFMKRGLGYKESNNKNNYHCLLARGQSKTKTIDRKWIPKEYLVNPIRKHFYWVPKSILKG